MEAEKEESKAAKPPQERPQASPKPIKATSGGRDAKAPQDPVAIFTLLDGVSSPPGTVNIAQLAKHLTAVHQFLLRETSFVDRKRYLSCPAASQASLYKKLEAQGLRAAASPGDSDDKFIEEGVNLFNTAAVIFSFFLPFSAGIPTASKFWGALERLVLVLKKPHQPLWVWVKNMSNPWHSLERFLGTKIWRESGGLPGDRAPPWSLHLFAASGGHDGLRCGDIEACGAGKPGENQGAR